jgi:hypothetical protein
MSQKPPTDRTRIRRVSERANYDQATAGTYKLLNLLKIFDKSKGIV